ncbi:MAG: DUF4350 domain-containing protein [Anaerolineae bacterium]|nr:DUF4350 domain-containing protein [Anaerolineae bacterium]
MKNLYKLLLILSVAALVFGGRLIWFYRGGYRAPEIADINADATMTLSTYKVFEDTPRPAKRGYVLVDAAHTNNLAANDLTPLRARLEARDVKVVSFEGDAAELESALHDATAMIAMAPSDAYTIAERDAIAAFVEDGGRLLLAADPTHPALESENARPTELDAFYFPSGVPAINSLANEFGIVYFEDYLYNLTDNAGNYRNVLLSPAEDEGALVGDLETVIFLATYSLQSDGAPLLQGDANTRSTLRTGEKSLAAAVLSADEQVLALGDITFMTDPYHTYADNDRLLSHIADWLAKDGRIRDELADFPYLFQGPVDVVQVSGKYLDPQLIAQGNQLLSVFEDADIEANLRDTADPEHDALLLGIFEDSDDVQELLAQSGITLTLLADSEEKEADSTDEGEPTPEATETPEEEETEDETEATPEPDEETEEEEETGKEPEKEKEEEEKPKGLLQIESVGALGQAGITLFTLSSQDGQLTVTIMAEDAEAISAALERLVTHDFDSCIQAQSATICSTGESQDLEPAEDEEKEEKEKETPPSGESSGRILVISVEEGDAGGARSSGDEFEEILSEFYDVTLWRLPDDGDPDYEDMQGYDAYIFDFGDFATESFLSPAFLAMTNIEAGGVMLIGAQPMPDTGDLEYADIDDLEVSDLESSLLEGFDPEGIITLLPAESDVKSWVIPGDYTDEDSLVLMMRGPESPSSGSPALIAAVDESTELDHIIIATFPFYRLPPEAQRTLALNAAAWLIGEKEEEAEGACLRGFWFF